MLRNQNCTSPLIGHNVIQFSTDAKNIGFNVTNDMIIGEHEQYICRKACIDIRSISTIRHLLSIDAKKPVICAIELPKLYYCKIIFHGSTIMYAKMTSECSKLIIKTNFTMS